MVGQPVKGYFMHTGSIFLFIAHLLDFVLFLIIPFVHSCMVSSIPI